MLSDATDVWPSATKPSELIRAFERLGAPIVAAACRPCWIGSWCTRDHVRGLSRAIPALERTRLFLNSGQIMGTRSGLLHWLDWSVAVMDAGDPRRPVLPDTPGLDRTLPSELSDQGLLMFYWAAHPDLIAPDASHSLFHTAKDLTASATPCAKHLAFPPGNKAFYETGSGQYCLDSLAGFGGFGWRCRGGQPELTHGGAAPPLFGWHFNGGDGRTLGQKIRDAIAPPRACGAGRDDLALAGCRAARPRAARGCARSDARDSASTAATNRCR